MNVVRSEIRNDTFQHFLYSRIPAFSMFRCNDILWCQGSLRHLLRQPVVLSVYKDIYKKIVNIILLWTLWFTMFMVWSPPRINTMCPWKKHRTLIAPSIWETWRTWGAKDTKDHENQQLIKFTNNLHTMFFKLRVVSAFWFFLGHPVVHELNQKKIS